MFFEKALGLDPQPCNLTKQKTMSQGFSYEIHDIFQKIFFKDPLQVTAFVTTRAGC